MNAAHVGYYLIGPGARELRQLTGRRPTLAFRMHELVEHWPSLFYLSGIALGYGADCRGIPVDGGAVHALDGAGAAGDSRQPGGA